MCIHDTDVVHIVFEHQKRGKRGDMHHWKKVIPFLVCDISREPSVVTTRACQISSFHLLCNELAIFFYYFFIIFVSWLLVLFCSASIPRKYPFSSNQLFQLEALFCLVLLYFFHLLFKKKNLQPHVWQCQVFGNSSDEIKG